jgi:hypothetical protein
VNIETTINDRVPEQFGGGRDPALEIVSVTPIPHHGVLSGQSVETPRPGEQFDGYVLPIAGWVYGAAVPVTRVHLRCGSRMLREVTPKFDRRDVAELYSAAGELPVGFLTELGAVDLPPSFEIELIAQIDDGRMIPFALVSGRRRALEPRSATTLRPIFVTNIGRVGSTVLMNLLRCHPQIVVHDLYPYETRALGYWMHMLKVLGAPADHERSASPNTYEDEGHWVGHHPHNMRPVIEPAAIGGWLRRDYIAELAAFCQTSAENFYRSVAAAQGVERPLYFAEKRNPRGPARLASELYPDARELFLVRDPRDMVCSMLSFYEKTRLVSFGRDHFTDDEQFVKSVVPALNDLIAQRAEREHRSLLVRYEDLVTSPLTELERILNYVELPAGPELRAEIVDRALRDTASSARHRTTSSAGASVGRWRTDLTPSMQAACESAFCDLLPALGYEQ